MFTCDLLISGPPQVQIQNMIGIFNAKACYEQKKDKWQKISLYSANVCLR